MKKGWFLYSLLPAQQVQWYVAMVVFCYRKHMSIPATCWCTVLNFAGVQSLVFFCLLSTLQFFIVGLKSCIGARWKLWPNWHQYITVKSFGSWLQPRLVWRVFFTLAQSSAVLIYLAFPLYFIFFVFGWDLIWNPWHFFFFLLRACSPCLLVYLHWVQDFVYCQFASGVLLHHGS